MRNVFLILVIAMMIGFVSCEKENYVPTKEEVSFEKGDDVRLKSKSTANISRSRMVSYALTYSEHWSSCTHEYGDERKRCTAYYNTNYVNYASSWSDCANFVSQTLKYGYLSEDAIWKYNSGYPSNAWVGANALYNYLTTYYYTSIYSVTGITDIDYSYYLDDAEVGDLVFYLRSDNGYSGSDHVMVVTGVVTGSNGANNIKLTGHTYNERNYRFNENYLQYYPNKTYRIVKL